MNHAKFLLENNLDDGFWYLSWTAADGKSKKRLWSIPGMRLNTPSTGKLV